MCEECRVYGQEVPCALPENRLGGWWDNRENVDECSPNDPILGDKATTQQYGMVLQ